MSGEEEYDHGLLHGGNPLPVQPGMGYDVLPDPVLNSKLLPYLSKLKYGRRWSSSNSCDSLCKVRVGDKISFGLGIGALGEDSLDLLA
jgi:hypothetical protein